MKKFLLSTLTLILSVATTLLGVYVFLEIAKLASLSFITQLSFNQVLVLWILIRIATYVVKEGNTKPFTEALKDEIYNTIVLSIYYLLIWGLFTLIL